MELWSVFWKNTVSAANNEKLHRVYHMTTTPHSTPLNPHLALFGRLTGYFVLSFAVGILANIALSSLRGAQFSPLIYSAGFASVYILGTLGLTYLYRQCVDRKPWRGMAFTWPRGQWLNLLGGLMAGGLAMLLVFASEYALGWVHIVGNEVQSNGISVAIQYLLAGLIQLLAVGICEELSYRGYMLQNLDEAYALWLAVLLNGLIFGLAHFLQTGFGVMSVLSMVIFSALLALSRLHTGALWWAIGWHTAWNWVQINLLGLSVYSEPNYDHALLHIEQSGPALWVGEGFLIESGLLCIGVTLLALALFYAWNRRSRKALDWKARLDENGCPEIQ